MSGLLTLHYSRGQQITSTNFKMFEMSLFVVKGPFSEVTVNLEL